MVQCENCVFLHYHVGCVLAGEKGGGVGLTLLPSNPAPLFFLHSAAVAAVYRLRNSGTKETPRTHLANPSRTRVGAWESLNTGFTRLQTADCHR